MVEQIGQPVGTQLCIDDVLMVGTNDYTAIGRPLVSKARVYATVEEISQTAKVLWFKMKRRKGYQRSGGHRQVINVLRVDRIEHQADESDFTGSNASLLKVHTVPNNFVL